MRNESPFQRGHIFLLRGQHGDGVHEGEHGVLLKVMHFPPCELEFLIGMVNEVPYGHRRTVAESNR